MMSITVRPSADDATAAAAMRNPEFLADRAPFSLPSHSGIAPSSAIAARSLLATIVFPMRLVNSEHKSVIPSTAGPAPPRTPLARSKARKVASPGCDTAADHPAPQPGARTGISIAMT